MSTERRGQRSQGTPGMPRGARIRAYITGAVMTTGLLAVTMRAWGLQVDRGDQFREAAEKQHERTVAMPPPRGQILDARGRPLAVSADVESVWANPLEVVDVTTTSEKVAELLGMDVRSLEERLGARRKFVWLLRHAGPELAQKIRTAKLPGIYVAQEPRRYYPSQSVGGPIIGRADIDGKGIDGLELSMDTLLHGQSQTIAAVRDARGRTLLTEGLGGPVGGANVHTTLDRTIMAITDGALADAVTRNQAKSGVAVVLDVKTGGVLAMASYPTLDPNANPQPGVAPARNRAVTDVYEIGSVMKVFTVAAALEAKVTRPHEMWNTEGGAYRVGPKTIRDVHHDLALSTSDIIKRSSNVGAVKIALRLGRERLYEALQRFGFGAKSNVELPGEQRGTMRDGSRWREIELATISFGYGMTVTPLQLAAGLAAIGNHGTYLPPHVIDKVVGVDGRVLHQPTVVPRQVLSVRNADAVLPMLASVFEPGGKGGKNPTAGTAGSIVVPGFACGGKTGTAHKMDPATKKYADDKYLSSFAGLAPIDDPRLAIVVVIDEPNAGDHYGGKVAGPAFATIASESLRYLGVPGTALPVATTEALSDRTKPAAAATASHVAAKAANATHRPAAAAANAASAVTGEAEDEATTTTSAAATTASIADAPADTATSADLSEEAPRAPSFIGMPLAQAVRLAGKAHVNLRLVPGSSGSVVIKQTPEPGAIIDTDHAAISLELGARQALAAKR